MKEICAHKLNWPAFYCAHRKPDSAQQQLKKARSLESFFHSTAIGENQWKPAEDDDNNLIERFGPAHQQVRQHSTVCAVVKENVRMRQTIKDVRPVFCYFHEALVNYKILYVWINSFWQAVLTLTQWIHQTKEQSDNVTLLVNMMKESAQVQSKLREDVEAMAIQVRIFYPPHHFLKFLNRL